MKLSTSSSLIFATLAISSSTSTMAAPTRDAPDSGLSPSKSRHNLQDSSMHSSPFRAGPRHGRSRSEVRSTASRMSARENPGGSGSGVPASGSPGQDASNNGPNPTVTAAGLLNPILNPLFGLPIVGPILKGLIGGATTTAQNLNAFSVDGSDIASAQGLSAEDVAAMQAGIAEIQRVFAAAAQNQTAPAAPTPSGAAPPAVQSGVNKTPIGAVAKSESDANASGWEGFSSSASSPPTNGDAASSATPAPSASASAAAFDAQAAPAQSSMSSAPSSSATPAAVNDVQSTSAQPSASSVPSSNPSAAAAALGLPFPALPVNLPNPPLPIDALPIKPSSLPLPAGLPTLPSPPA